MKRLTGIASMRWLALCRGQVVRNRASDERGMLIVSER
jgi:hypothetical protein